MHLTFSMCILEIQVEESVFQNCVLGLSFYLIKCRIWCIKNMQKVTQFLT